MSTDSVSVFAEGTFEEQIQELVNYIVRNRSEDARTAFIRPFQDALKTDKDQKPFDEDPDRRRKVFSMVIVEIKGVGDGSDKEIEGFFNLVFSHFFVLFPGDAPETKTTLNNLLQVITSSPKEQTSVKYRILSNLFNATPRKSSLRLPIYNTLLSIALSNNELEILRLSKNDVSKWLVEWDITPEEKNQFLKAIVDAYAQTGQIDTSYDYTLLYVRSISPSSSNAQAIAIEAISTALRIPTVFDFDPLFKLETVVASKDHELFSLLQVFLNSGLPEFKTWESNHPGALEKYKLDRATLERKIRLLTLASLGFDSIGHDLPYSKIAEALQVDLKNVEEWAIDVIRAGLLSGKLSQMTQTLHVTRSTARSFQRPQWEALEKRLVAWKTGLGGVHEIVAGARKRNEQLGPQPIAHSQAVTT